MQVSQEMARKISGEVYEQEIKLVYHTVTKFMKRRHVPKRHKENFISIASEAFFKCWVNYEPERAAKFSTVAVVYMNNAMSSHWKTYNKISEKILRPLHPELVVKPKFSAEEFAMTLTEDASLVVLLTLEFREARDRKKSLYKLLRLMGWRKKRIWFAFREVEEALREV